jgi:signal transduction histidine kinase
MKQVALKIWHWTKSYVERFPIIIAAVVIYLYYFITSLNLFEHSEQKRTFFDFLVQFDSLILLWLIAAAFLQVQKYRKAHKKEEERRREMERIIDRQKIYKQIVNDVTMLLQDSVNNPLAIISVTTQELRRKYEKDEEMIRWLGRIETSVARINDTMRGLRGYEAEKMLESTTEIVTMKEKDN